jgi:hypothetical protein
MAVVYAGIDLAKNMFAVHGVSEHGKPVLARPKVARDKRHDRRGSVFGCAPLGVIVGGSGPCGAADGAEVRRTLPVVRPAGQGRSGGRGGD